MLRDISSISFGSCVPSLSQVYSKPSETYLSSHHNDLEYYSCWSLHYCAVFNRFSNNIFTFNSFTLIVKSFSKQLFHFHFTFTNFPYISLSKLSYF